MRSSRALQGAPLSDSGRRGATAERKLKPAATRLAAGVVALSVLCSAALLLEAARGDSVTIDEFAHLPAGLYYLHTGRFNLYNLSPPLLRIWCALPAWWAGAPANFADFVSAPDHWLLGYDFMAHNAARYQELFFLARLPAVVLVLVLVLVVALAAWRAFGPGAGVAAAVLCAFSPNILAHGHLVTTDLGHTFFFLLAVLAYERVLRRPSAASVLAAGVVLGLAQLTKFTALLLYPILAVLTAIAAARRGTRLRLALAFVGCVVVSGIVLNAGYLFQGCGAPLAGYELHSSWLQRLAKGPPGHVPLPLPADFVTGYDQQAAEAQGQYSVFFHGQLSRTGWWYYYLAALALKTPIPALLLVAAGLVVLVAGGRWRRDPLGSAVLVLPPLVYLTLFSWLTDINLGVRYVLPVYPFLFLTAASLWAAPWAARGWMRAVLAVALLAQVGATWLSRPYYLSYFNALAGGSQNGYRWLIDSNVDWGQELLRLRAYLQARDITQVRLAYFGRVAPEVYGIDYQVIQGALQPAVYVVSASYLMGRPYYLYDHGELYWVPQNAYAGFQRYTPTVVIGHSLFVFDLRAQGLAHLPLIPPW